MDARSGTGQALVGKQDFQKDGHQHKRCATCTERLDIFVGIVPRIVIRSFQNLNIRPNLLVWNPWLMRKPKMMREHLQYLRHTTYEVPFKSVAEIHSISRLQCVHSDICGSMPTDSIGGSKYFVTFIEDYTRCYKVYFMRNKSEVFDKLKEFKLLITNECGLSIGTL